MRIFYGLFFGSEPTSPRNSTRFYFWAGWLGVCCVCTQQAAATNIPCLLPPERATLSTIGNKTLYKSSKMDAAKVEEITKFFEERLATSKKIAASRGKEARIAAHQAKMASGKQTWRQMSGIKLMAHEVSHVGNRPFMVGFA